jgi:ketosteroid isomerase-like protein
VTKAQTQTLAHKWIAAFNDHDLETILSHYAESVELTSPLVTKVLGDPAGTVRGKHALRAFSCTRRGPTSPTRTRRRRDT